VSFATLQQRTTRRYGFNRPLEKCCTSACSRCILLRGMEARQRSHNFVEKGRTILLIHRSAKACPCAWKRLASKIRIYGKEPQTSPNSSRLNETSCNGCCWAFTEPRHRRRRLRPPSVPHIPHGRQRLPVPPIPEPEYTIGRNTNLKVRNGHTWEASNCRPGNSVAMCNRLNDGLSYRGKSRGTARGDNICPLLLHLATRFFDSMKPPAWRSRQINNNNRPLHCLSQLSRMERILPFC
jgi:hypothetical protein